MISTQSQTDDDRRWIVMSYTAEQLRHLSSAGSGPRQTLTELFTARLELKPHRLAPMHALEAKSRDGLAHPRAIFDAAGRHRR